MHLHIANNARIEETFTQSNEDMYAMSTLSVFSCVSLFLRNEYGQDESEKLDFLVQVRRKGDVFEYIIHLTLIPFLI